MCKRVPRCGDVELNAARTWATLKRLADNTSAAVAAAAAAAGGGRSPVGAPWCAPALAPERHGGRCVGESSLCAVVADMAPSRAVMGRFIGRLIDSLPARVPSAAVSPREYPLERHAAVSYLAYLHEAYDGLPQNGAALALLADVGDAHYLPGRGHCNTCALATHLGELAAAPPDALRHPKLFKSLAPRPPPPTAAAATANFVCAEHTLSKAEAAVWRAVLQPTLGPPPPRVAAYTGGQFLVAAAAVRAATRALGGSAARCARARRRGRCARGAAAVGGGCAARRALHPQSFRCDADGGWGAAGAVVAVRPAAMAAVAAEPSTDVAPMRPSAAERATGCGRNATTGEVAAACAVIVVHKEPVYWAADLPMAVPPYRRHVTADGLYVVPNVYHEHAVYLHYIAAFYDELPPLSVFLHGHRSSWHNTRLNGPAVDRVRELVKQSGALADPAPPGAYVSLNDYDQCFRDVPMPPLRHYPTVDGRGKSAPRLPATEWAAEVAAQAHGWERQMAPEIGAAPPLREAYCCTQFAVSADRIRRRSHAFWRRPSPTSSTSRCRRRAR